MRASAGRAGRRAGALCRVEGAGLLTSVLAHLRGARDLACASAVSRGWRAAALADDLWQPLCAPYPLIAVLKARPGRARSWRSLLSQRLLANREREIITPLKITATRDDFCVGIELWVQQQPSSTRLAPVLSAVVPLGHRANNIQDDHTIAWLGPEDLPSKGLLSYISVHDMQMTLCLIRNRDNAVFMLLQEESCSDNINDYSIEEWDGDSFLRFATFDHVFEVPSSLCDSVGRRACTVSFTASIFVRETCVLTASATGGHQVLSCGCSIHGNGAGPRFSEGRWPSIVCGICHKDVMTVPCGVDVSLEDDDEDDDYLNTVYPGTTIDELAAAVSAPVAATGWT